ncbi:hypothetical protein F5148DRAFT_1149197 [Russula earlei]|uniref:Uncharacterized protein n=1 Tax=Russula earlei TaxID=71964 RepID=A0ACC0UA54_9AGAM|nr:hypothetical protein F5148DRAFT_1149197 [Russula earlei]
MILNEEDASQRPKLRGDPSVGPTNRAPPPTTDRPASSSFPRPPSPNPTLPDYDTSEAQQMSNHKRSSIWRFWRTRAGKMVTYALVIYTLVLVLVGVPAFMMRPRRGHKFRWDDLYLDNVALRDAPPPPPPAGHQLCSRATLGPNRTLPFREEEKEDEEEDPPRRWPAGPCTLPFVPTPRLPSERRPDGADAVLGSALRMRLSFPLVEGIGLRLNTSSPQGLRGYVNGTLTVMMNPDQTESGTALLASARYSNFNLFKASSLCLSHVGNHTAITIQIPERAKNSSDVIEMDLQLLLPRTPTPIGIKSCWVHFPKSFFEKLQLADSGSSITVGTSGAQISGNFSATRKLYLDTINGAVFANVSLHNSKKQRKPTRLSIETGNGPIVANVTLDVDERLYFTAPKCRNFAAKFKTFNAPMDVSIAHAKGSQPGRISLLADNAQGPIDVSLDALYTGTFDVRTKQAAAQVLESIAVPGEGGTVHGNDFDDGDDDGEKHEVHFAHVSNELVRGWVGDSRTPEQFDSRTLGRVELSNSLSPSRLHLERLRPSTTYTFCGPYLYWVIRVNILRMYTFFFDPERAGGICKKGWKWESFAVTTANRREWVMWW